MLENAVFWIFLLILCFSLLKYTYYYNYRSRIYLQVAKLAKSAGGQIPIFPTIKSPGHVANVSQYLNSFLQFWETYSQHKASLTRSNSFTHTLPIHIHIMQG